MARKKSKKGTKAKAGAKQPKKTLSCDVCGKTFSMAAHLGRHKSAIHGARAKTAKKKTTRKRRKKAVARKTAARKAGRKRLGRPPAIASRFGLRDLPLDDLASLIKAARQEANRRLRDYESLLSD